MVSYNLIYSYLLAFAFTIVGLVYLLKVPYQFAGTNNQDLVDLYYFTDYKRNIPLDILVVGVYLAISHAIIVYSQLQPLWAHLLIVIATTACISSAFYWYFVSYSKSSNFFSRWFTRVGFRAVFYDMFYVGFTYFVFRHLYDKWLTN